MSEPNKSNIELLDTAEDIWEFLKREGGIDTRLYDSALEQELRESLGLPGKGKFETLLTKHKVGTEVFVSAFLNAVSPYSSMMSELLTIFEKSGVKSTNQNMPINYDFGTGAPETLFDIEHFKQEIEVWNEVVQEFSTRVWGEEQLWNLNRVLSGYININETNPEVTDWLEEYRSGIWPDVIPDCPGSGVPDLDTKLNEAWRIWRKVVKESARYGKARFSAIDSGFESGESQSSGEQPPAENYSRCESDESQSSSEPPLRDISVHEDWSPALLYRIDQDYWAASVISGISGIASYVSGLSKSAPEETARAISSELGYLLEQIPRGISERTTLQNRLKDILSLPFWQKRHELYSVWIFSQILSAVEHLEPRVHVVGENLSFSFSGTHLATLGEFISGLHVWAELKSPLLNPRGKSRKRAIQPDYSLVTNPITNPLSSVLEIECKQYLRPSAKNFSDALTDYANGRPNAHVMLVNYGPSDKSTMDLVDASVIERTSFIGKMRPDNEAAKHEFRTLVQQVLESKLADDKVAMQSSEADNATEESVAHGTLNDRPKDSGKNIVICLDGTGNQYGEDLSNIVKLFRMIERTPGTQVAYYDPGVGTMGDPMYKTWIARKINKVLGLAFGRGLTRNLIEAYTFLVEHYENGDRVFLFGFSRGAYTARALAAFIRQCGLFENGSENLIPYAMKLFLKKEKTKDDFRMLSGFRSTYGRQFRREDDPKFPDRKVEKGRNPYHWQLRIHFLGLFDTVKSYGWVRNPVKLSEESKNPSVLHVRHALSIDERRIFFRQLHWISSPGQDCREVWFPGVHADVGGGYPEPESGLSKIALEWMVHEACALGLKVDRYRYHRAMGRIRNKNGYWEDGNNENYPAPSATAPAHESLNGWWRIVQPLPKSLEHWEKDKHRRTIKSEEDRPRLVAPDQKPPARGENPLLVHQSVLDRIDEGQVETISAPNSEGKNPKSAYRPKNLIDSLGDPRSLAAISIEQTRALDQVFGAENQD